jgi:hypothetical protein
LNAAEAEEGTPLVVVGEKCIALRSDGRDLLCHPLQYIGIFAKLLDAFVHDDMLGKLGFAASVQFGK